MESEWLEDSRQETRQNQDLWIALDEQCQRHAIDWQWVKGHAGHPENERRPACQCRH